MFCRTLNGAKVGDLFMSLIHTAESQQVEPFDYLVALRRHAAAVALARRPGCLGITPRRWRASPPNPRRTEPAPAAGRPGGLPSTPSHHQRPEHQRRDAAGM